jgi:hypothetical protein
MSATPERLAHLRRAIADGSYAPEPDAVAESLLGWVVPPDAFEAPTDPDRFKSPDRTVEGPLDPAAGRRDTSATDTETRR